MHKSTRPSICATNPGQTVDAVIVLLLLFATFTSLLQRGDIFLQVIYYLDTSRVLSIQIKTPFSANHFQMSWFSLTSYKSAPCTLISSEDFQCHLIKTSTATTALAY